MSIVDIEAAANAAHFGKRFIPAQYRPPVGPITDCRVDIDRNAEVRDQQNMLIESRCELCLIVDEVGSGERGAVLMVGTEEWRLAKPIGDDGYESRWVAVPE